MPKGTSKTEAATIYQLKITLDYIDPPIWRRVQLPGATLLSQLHDLIQTVMGWEDDHLHSFQVGNASYSDPEFDDGDEDESRISLAEVVPARGKKFKYMYDFGDSWRHTIVVEKIVPPEAGQSYPVCIAGARACPPEDCGGAWGYREIVEAMSNPEHERREELLEWLGEEFDPEEFNLEGTNAALRL